MIIDIHTHVGEYKRHYSESFAKIVSEPFGLDPEKTWNIDPNEFIRDMDEAEVDKAVILPLDITRNDPGTKVEDEYVYNNYVNKHPDRFIAFSGIQPMDSSGKFSSESLKQFEEAVINLGFRGMKALPAYSRFPPNHRSMYPFYQKAVDLGVPVLLHMGPTAYTPAKLKYGNPCYLDDVALDFPDLKICVAHMAYSWQPQLFGLMRKCKNVYTDISALCGRPMELAWNLVLAKEYKLINRVMWGTDYPVCNPKNYIEWLQKGLNNIANKCGWPNFSNRDINKMLGENAIEFLGLVT